MTDEELREYQERAVQFRDLATHPSWPLFEDFLRWRLGTHQRRVVNGHIADINEYKHETGIVKGLSIALQAADEVERLVQAEMERRGKQG